MNQEKFGQFIKDIRKKNNLTQKEFADKYHVTYQAVSKWENGKNMPDMSLIKQISDDFNVSIEELLDGEVKKKNNINSKYIIIGLIVIIIVSIITIVIMLFNSDFQFHTLSSNCDVFNISGTVAHNKQKSAIYITNIEYCGEENTDLYNKFECVLYEKNGDIDRKVTSFNYEDEEKITLDEFLKTVTIKVDDYKNTCSKYSSDSLYLSVNAIDGDTIITYKIPLKLDDCD